MAGIIGIELPAEDYEQVSEKDKADIGQATVAAERQLDGLIRKLEVRGCERAAKYSRYAKDRLFTYGAGG